MQQLLLVLVLLYAAWMGFVPLASRHRPKRYPLVKGAESALFVLCGLLAHIGGASAGTSGAAQGRNFALLFAALLLCMAGDIFLAFTTSARRMKNRAFLCGGLSFFAAHALFCVLFYLLVPFKIYDLILPILVLAVMYRLDSTGKVRLAKVRPLAYPYSFIVALMAVKAVEVGARYFGIATAPGLFIALGGVLFFVSDCVLLFVYFGQNRRFWMKVVNLVAYFSGMMFLALSAWWL